MNELDILEQHAIDYAINLRWDEAIKVNKQIFRLDPTNLNAILRLGFAYMQLVRFKDAKKSYRQALKIQSENQIARENLERIKVLQDEKVSKKSVKKELRFDPNLFLELPGKTKSMALVNLGQKNILANMVTGEEVCLRPKKRKIEIRTKSNEYIGSLPDDLSKRLYLFIKAGSEYSAYIKEVSFSRVVVFIRENKKGKKVMRYVSFPKTTQIITTPTTQEESTDHEQTRAEEVEEDSILVNDLEKLAETLHEEKEFFQFNRDDEDEENLEE